MKDVLGSPDDDGVASIVAPLGAHDDVGVFGEEIDDFTFAFIAPLGADENGVCHRKMKMGEDVRRTDQRVQI